MSVHGSTSCPYASAFVPACIIVPCNQLIDPAHAHIFFNFATKGEEDLHCDAKQSGVSTKSRKCVTVTEEKKKKHTTERKIGERRGEGKRRKERRDGRRKEETGDQEEDR